MNMFKTETWKKWNDEFNKFAGGYKYRWGDIEVIGLYSYIFLDKPLYDFKLAEKNLYTHKPKRNEIVNIKNNVKWSDVYNT
jgi:hypothetical protein